MLNNIRNLNICGSYYHDLVSKFLNEINTITYAILEGFYRGANGQRIREKIYSEAEMLVPELQQYFGQHLVKLVLGLYHLPPNHHRIKNKV